MESAQKHLSRSQTRSEEVSISKPELGGFIFICSNWTMPEYLQRQLFGLPLECLETAKAIKPGLPLFLYNSSNGRLHGVFEVQNMASLKSFFACAEIRRDGCPEFIRGTSSLLLPLRAGGRIPLQEFLQIRTISRFWANRRFLRHAAIQKFQTHKIVQLRDPGQEIPIESVVADIEASQSVTDLEALPSRESQFRAAYQEILESTVKKSRFRAQPRRKRSRPLLMQISWSVQCLKDGLKDGQRSHWPPFL